MRKSIFRIAIVLFIALFAFVGCEKDKSAEVVSLYEEYLRTEEGCANFTYMCEGLSYLQGEDDKITKEDIPLEVAVGLARMFYEDRLVTEVVSAEGSVDVDYTNEDDVISQNISASGVKISYKYNVVKLDENGDWVIDAEGKPVILKEGLSDTFVMSGISSAKIETKKNLMSIRISGIEFDGVSYSSIEESAYLSTRKAISLKVGGKDVPLTLIDNFDLIDGIFDDIFI